MTPSRLAKTACALLLLSCGGESQDRAQQAAEDVSFGLLKVPPSLAAVDLARKAFELLDLTPRYTCGEPRGTFVGKVADGIVLRYPCAAITAEALASSDSLTATFPQSGCKVRGHQLSGASIFQFSGGESRLELAGDLRTLSVDGQPLQTRVGYVACSAQTTYSAVTDGTLAKYPGKQIHLDASVAVREGLPVIGDTVVEVDGTGSLTEDGAVDRLTLTGVQYELGGGLPKSGSLLLETASGHRVLVVFAEKACSGEITVTVDDHPSVTLPVG